MPHALLTGTLPPSSTLSKTVIRYGGGHVVLHEAASVMPPGSQPPAIDELVSDRMDSGREDTNRWLVRASVEEPDLKQQLLVMVHQRQPAEVIVRLETFGDPVITAAVRGAVHGVTEWLLANTDLSIKRRSY